MDPFLCRLGADIYPFRLAGEINVQRTARRLSESSNGRLLNETLLRSLPHARVALDTWRWDYNAERRHGTPRQRVPTPTNYPYLRRTNPLRRDRLCPLIRDEFSAAGLLLGADRSWILPKLRPHGHGFLDSRPLADFFQPALYIGGCGSSTRAG